MKYYGIITKSGPIYVPSDVTKKQLEKLSTDTLIELAKLKKKGLKDNLIQFILKE